MSELYDYIIDLLIDFDEMGFVPSVAVPNTEAYAIKWRDKITKAIEELSRVVDANSATPTSEWISVDERLPEKLTHVIVHDEDGTVGEAFYLSGDRFEWVTSEELAFVTHWMPLPEAPKGGE